MSSRHWRGSNFSITTTVAPSRCIDIEYTSGAAWYSGAGDRYTVPGVTPYMPMPCATCTGAADGSPNGVSGSGLRTPFGRPVVPDE